MPPTKKSPYRLLVEGLDDQNSIIHLLTRHNYDWNEVSADRPYIQQTGGLTELLDSIPVTLKGPYDRLGIVVDVDVSMQNRWAQLRSRVAKTGLELPETPLAEGTILGGLRPGSRIGLWLMPDNFSPGNLESFLHKLVPESDPTWPYSGEVTSEARRRGARCKEVDHLKSALHTWLAWQEEPGLPFGTALRAQVFRHDTEDALRFVAWFRRLFVDA